MSSELYLHSITSYFSEEFMDKKVERQKAKSKGFAILGVPVGAVLTFRKDPSITCKTLDDKNKVEYQGKTYLISGLAKELMNTPISGYHAFKYNGVLLAKLGGSTEKPTEQAADPSSVPVQPAEEAPVAPETEVPPKPQTIPLPRPQEAATEPQEASPEEDAEDPDGSAEDSGDDVYPTSIQDPLEGAIFYEEGEEKGETPAEE
jgi:hypothetical protein